MTQNADERSTDDGQEVRGPVTRDRPLQTTYSNAVGVGVAASVLLHWAALDLSPTMMARDVSEEESEATTAVSVPPRVEVPPPPKTVQQPRTPQVESGRPVVEEEVSIEPEELDRARSATDVPPPPDAEEKSTRNSGPRWVPREVAPKLKNRAELRKLLEELYPKELYRKDVEGRVILWVRVNKKGRVTETRVRESSGHEELDRAARKAARQLEFEPAMNRDKRIAVWTQQAITFSAEMEPGAR